jgi:hypothetical protein
MVRRALGPGAVVENVVQGEKMGIEVFQGGMH